MKERTVRTLTFGFLVSLFIFAGNMLAVGKGSLSELLLAAALGAVSLPVSAFAASSVFGEGEKNGASRVIFFVLSVAVAAAAIFVAGKTVWSFADFVGDVMLLRLPAVAVSVIFVLLCSYIAYCGEATVKKFTLVAFFVISLSALILFLLSLPALEFERIGRVLGGLGANGVLKTFSEVFAPAVLAVVYISATGEKRARASLYGTVIATVLLTLCFLNVFLLLGGLGNSEDYPYSVAVSTVTAGKLFVRMEGFSYIMYYAAGAVRVSVCISLVRLLCERILKKKYAFIPYLIGAAVLSVTLLLSLS